MRDGGRGNKHRTFEFLQPEGCKNSKVRFAGFISICICIYQKANSNDHQMDQTKSLFDYHLLSKKPRAIAYT